MGRVICFKGAFGRPFFYSKMLYTISKRQGLDNITEFNV
jgi:hypothetical protein